MIIYLQNNFWYPGVPIRQKIYMYGYNESIDDISTNFYANIYKSHTSLSFHQVREAIESNTVALYNVYG